jgi:tripartite-type tricarboxylate transporter receptor subunit TctC
MVCFAVLVDAPASAQEYPSKPLRMIVGFPPGGPTDINGRLFARAMSAGLGQPLIVENKAGASGNIAAAEAARSSPDGYTIFYNTSSLVLAPSLGLQGGFDPIGDFAPVATTATLPLLLVVNPAVPARDSQSLISYLKASSSPVFYGSSGAGAMQHLAAVLFASQFQVRLSHVPYKGSAPALIDLIAGQTQTMFVGIVETLPHVRAGKLRAIAIAASKRSPLLPEVPTLAEATGARDMEMGAWQGIVVPKGTPPAVVARLNREVNRALEDKGLLATLASQGAEPLGGTAEHYGAFLKAELARWAKVIRDAGLKPQ